MAVPHCPVNTAPFAPYPPGYVPRHGAASALHEAIPENVETFLAEACERTAHNMGVPRFVEEELRAILRCGVLVHGFARVQPSRRVAALDGCRMGVLVARSILRA